MPDSGRICYLDTKAVVVYSVSYILNKHGFSWIGDRPRIPISFSPNFYKVLRHILDLFDEEFTSFYDDLTPSVFADPARAIEDAGHKILRNRKNSEEVAEFLNVSQTNVIALIYFSAVVAIKVQEKENVLNHFATSAQYVNGYHQSNGVDDSAKGNGEVGGMGFKKRKLLPYQQSASIDSLPSPSSVTSTPLSDESEANLADSNMSSLKSSGYGSATESFSTYPGNTSAKYPYSSTTVYIVNKASSFINKHVGHHISANNGWEPWLTSKLRNRVESTTTGAPSAHLDESDFVPRSLRGNSKWPQVVMGMIGASALLALMLRSRDS